jgi:hypothetical protein
MILEKLFSHGINISYDLLRYYIQLQWQAVKVFVYSFVLMLSFSRPSQHLIEKPILNKWRIFQENVKALFQYHQQLGRLCTYQNQCKSSRPEYRWIQTFHYIFISDGLRGWKEEKTQNSESILSLISNQNILVKVKVEFARIAAFCSYFQLASFQLLSIQFIVCRWSTRNLEKSFRIAICNCHLKVFFRYI